MRIVTAEQAAVVMAGLAEIPADRGRAVGAAEAPKAAERWRRRLPAHRPGWPSPTKFLDALAGSAAGGTALHPEVVTGTRNATGYAGNPPRCPC